MSTRRSAWNWAGAVLAFLVTTTPLMAQETGTIVGIVRTEAGEAVPGAQVFVVPQDATTRSGDAPQLGALTQANGRYMIQQVPPGDWIVRVELIGYADGASDVSVAAGETVTANFTLRSEAIALEQIVVTGVSGATQRAKVPFDVSQIDARDLPVPQVSAASAIQGKVAGASVVQGSGRPGSSPSILLRGATSINASGRNQEPLYIVDGVIIGSGLVDISALDIQTIEVVKGAAAASLYGSRAASGVIQITTKRGANVADNDVRYTVRTEYGRSELASTPDALLADAHPFQLEARNDTTFFVNEGTGDLCAWLDCSSPALAGTDQWDSYYVNQWPSQFDQVESFFQNGTFAQQYFSAEGRSGATNFHASYSNLQDNGVIPGLDGYARHNFRLNVDQAVLPQVQVSASAFYSRSENDQFPENSGNPIFTLTRTPAGVDIFACEAGTTDDAGNEITDCRNRPEDIVLQTDPTNSEAANPAYELLNRSYRDQRGRFLGSASVRWSPLAWFSLEGAGSYDRLDWEATDLFPKGFRTVRSNAFFNEGYMDRYLEQDESFNGSVTGSFLFNLSDAIQNRTQLRYLYEENNQQTTFTYSYNATVSDIDQFQNFRSTNTRASSSFQPVRADGYFAITNFEILDRYVIDALIRNDGSSLFGEDERRQWYYRLAGAWRVGEEPWFTVPAVDEMKLRYSYGTAGGRPSFSAQYETFSVSGGAISPVALGNADLRPEFSREHEAGLDLSVLEGRAVFGLTYANTVTDDQILPVPLPDYTGYATRWINAGTLESNTWELSLNTRLVQRGAFRWDARFLYDRTRSTITSLNVPAFSYGVGGQGLGNVFYAREGEELGTFYGVEFATECGHLPASLQSGCEAGQFATNDDGFLVWVGDHGMGAQAWGEAAPASIQDAAPHLFNLRYGVPIAAECTDAVTQERQLFCPVGNSTPDYQFSVSQTMTFGGLSVYGLIDAVQGFDVYNQPLQWATFAGTSGLFDQTDVPEDERKPIGYFDMLYGVSGLQPSSYFVEDGSFVKLRELSLRYRFGGDVISDRLPVLQRLSGVSIFAVGRNLKTWTDYRGFDPEVGKAGGQTGSAALARVEGYQYPNFRTWTFGTEINF